MKAAVRTKRFIWRMLSGKPFAMRLSPPLESPKGARRNHSMIVLRNNNQS
jgi:hypothetical protein